MNEKLNNYFLGKLSVEEKKELFEELETNEELKEDFARMQNTLLLTELLPKDDDEEYTNCKLNELQARQRSRKLRLYALRIFKYASCIALTIMLTWWLTTENSINQTENSFTRVDVPKGQRIHLTLPDGSEAWLSSLSELDIPTGFMKDHRKVKLNGEGYFIVAKDARPFIVETGKYNVCVHGTTFNVFAYEQSERFEVNLIEGKVTVELPEQQGEGISLSPAEKIYLENGTLIKAPSEYTSSEYLNEGIYIIEDESLAEVLERLELWYGVRFIIDKVQTEKIISGKFRQSDRLETILDAISSTGVFSYELLNQREIKIK